MDIQVFTSLMILKFVSDDGFDNINFYIINIVFLSLFLLNAFNIVFPNYKNRCLGMEDVVFDFLYFA